MGRVRIVKGRDHVMVHLTLYYASTTLCGVIKYDRHNKRFIKCRPNVAPNCLSCIGWESHVAHER